MQSCIWINKLDNRWQCMRKLKNFFSSLFEDGKKAKTWNSMTKINLQNKLSFDAHWGKDEMFARQCHELCNSDRKSIKVKGKNKRTFRIYQVCPQSLFTHNWMILLYLVYYFTFWHTARSINNKFSFKILKFLLFTTLQIFCELPF